LNVCNMQRSYPLLRAFPLPYLSAGGASG
jgi:hypothetical protein